MPPHMLPFWPSIALVLVHLSCPVPSPENPQVLPSFFLSQGFGARVTHSASGMGGSSIAPDLQGTPAKCHEAWALSGLGPVESRSRCNRLKRSYTRACARAMREGYATFKGKQLYPHQIPFRIKQHIQAQLPQPRKIKPTPTSHKPGLGQLRMFQWNASRSIEYHSWLQWCDDSPFDIIAVQESGWSMTNEWSTQRWHIVHSADRFCSILFMVRAALVRQDQLSIAHHVHGRVLQVRLNFPRPLDFVIVYQQAWSLQHGARQILQKRQHVWQHLQHCLERLPLSHQVIVCGDFNTPLPHIPYQVHTADPRYAQTAQRDKLTFSALIQKFNLVALHCHDRYQPTFKHGTHSSRIDFALMRKPQISWPVTAPQLLTDFVFNFGLLGPHHHPLTWTIPKWYPGPRPKPIVLFDRHRIRQEMKQNTSRWQGFFWEARQLFQSQIARDSSLFLQLENNLTELCKTWFPKQTSMPVASNPLASITAQMWQARKVVRALTDRLPATLFMAWKHLTLFRRCHKQIRHFSRQNKRQKLEDFLREGAHLAMRHQTYDWFRKIRKFSPKQRPQKIR